MGSEVATSQLKSFPIQMAAETFSKSSSRFVGCHRNPTLTNQINVLKFDTETKIHKNYNLILSTHQMCLHTIP